MPVEEPGMPMCFIVMPQATFRLLSDAAAARNLTMAQALTLAVHEFLEKTEPSKKGE
jgi:hypothetical protein